MENEVIKKGEEKKTKNKYGKQKTNNSMVDLNTNRAVIILNENGLNILIKTQKLPDQIKRKTKSNLTLLQEVCKNTEGVEGNGLEKIHHKC